VNIEIDEKIIMRNDDILLFSKGHKDPAAKFTKYHRWMLEGLEFFKHVPTILVRDIQQFPKIIEYIREETAEGRMFPELHGYEHVDYANLPEKEVDEHLERSVEWMERELRVRPKKFYTPWGADANNPVISSTSAKYGLTPIDISKVVMLGKAVALVKENSIEISYRHLKGREILTHWWQRGLRVPRIVKSFRHGGWEAAALAESHCF
jgi:peptidoglycan/xylan/chitin deacetylase (PgdA/CDA1 family)